MEQIKNVSLLVLVSTSILYLIAFGLALGAESRRSTAVVGHDDTGTLTYCAYSKDISTGLGVGAFLFVILAQSIIMFVSKCMCCGAPLSDGRPRTLAIFCFIFSWICFFIAEICIAGASARNSVHTNGFAQPNVPLDCVELRRGVFGIGAAFVFITMILTEAYYVFVVKAREGSWHSFDIRDSFNLRDSFKFRSFDSFNFRDFKNSFNFRGDPAAANKNTTPTPGS